MSSVQESRRTKSSIEYAARVNLRTLMHGPTSDSGGMITLTREPSGKRASTMGLLSSTRRPSGRDDAVDDAHQLLGVAEVNIRGLQPARCARHRRCSAR